MTKRRKFTDQFKAKIALETQRGDKTIQVSAWKRQAVEGMADVLSKGDTPSGPTEAEVKDLHAKIGRRAAENDFLSQGPKRRAQPRKKSMIDRDRRNLSIARQCNLLHLSRSAFYCKPAGMNEEARAACWR